MKLLASIAAIVSVASAEFGYWKLYCGDSCSTGTLIGQGDLENNVTSNCTPLGATYDYCYLEVDESYPNVYRSVLSADTTCGRSTNPILNGGNCSSAGRWGYYEIYYYV